MDMLTTLYVVLKKSGVEHICTHEDSTKLKIFETWYTADDCEKLMLNRMQIRLKKKKSVN